MANGQNPFQSEFLPPEFNEQLFQQAQFGRQRGVQRGIEALQQQFQAAGVDPRSGVVLRGALEDVIGPEEEFQRQLARNIALQGAQFGREERLGELGFQRQRQFRDEGFQQQLEGAEQQFGFQRSLQELLGQQTIAQINRRAEQERASETLFEQQRRDRDKKGFFEKVGGAIFQPIKTFTESFAKEKGFQQAQ